VVAAFLAVAARKPFWQGLAAPDLALTLDQLEPSASVRAIDEDYLDDIAAAFASVIDAKSPFTSGHSERVTLYTDMIAEQLALAPQRRRWLRRAALLHDIGKLGVSNAILDKPGKLDAAEWAQMQRHATFSGEILASTPVFADLAATATAHHEKLDGTGYPLGLRGEAITLDTRIITVADIFDALTADRPYRPAMPVAKALGILREGVGTAVDGRCVDALAAGLAAIG
jgi:HD-GYP domain-containing protein (c-di-GMP phosphodiesterase class II)